MKSTTANASTPTPSNADTQPTALVSIVTPEVTSLEAELTSIRAREDQIRAAIEQKKVEAQAAIGKELEAFAASKGLKPEQLVPFIRQATGTQVSLHRNRMSESQKKQLETLLKSSTKMTSAEVAKRFGISRQSVFAAKSRLNLTRTYTYDRQNPRYLNALKKRRRMAKAA